MNGQLDRLRDHHILGYVGVYVDDLLIAGPRSLNDSMIRAVQEVWKTSAPEHLGPDIDCVPVLRFLGMNLEQVDAEKSEELGLPVGTILLNQVECFIEVLMKFEPSLELKTRTTPGIENPLRVSRRVIFPLMMRSRSIFNHSRPLRMMRSSEAPLQL